MEFFLTLLLELWFDDANNYVELIFGLKSKDPNVVYC